MTLGEPKSAAAGRFGFLGTRATRHAGGPAAFEVLLMDRADEHRAHAALNAVPTW